MNQAPLATLPQPRFVVGEAMHLVGLSQRYTRETSAAIPSQWQKFVPLIGHIPRQIGKVAYGVLYNGDGDGNTDYLTAVEVPDFTSAPADLARLRIPEQRYVVFAHDGHVSAIRSVWSTIWSSWFPASGHEPAAGPSFERYGERFDPSSGNGGFEIWIPLKS